MNPTHFDNFTLKIIQLIELSRTKVLSVVNHTMVFTYYEIGKMIIEEEQNGSFRSEYGKKTLINLSNFLSLKFGKGFSVDNLQNMRLFYSVYQNYETASHNFNLSWSHYLKLMRMTNIEERNFYEIESFKNNWSLRELQRQFDSGLYVRLALNKNKSELLNLSTHGQLVEKPKDLIKDPYILEFLGLSDKSIYSENDLEQKIIDKLEQFLLELGTGYTFVARQKRISFDEKHFKIDLVFYNRILKCFILIDLKIGELKHQDIGQMQMYVNFYDREIKLFEENKTIGIILCQDKSQALVEYTLPENNEQIFASKYLTILPSKETLIKLLEENKEIK